MKITFQKNGGVKISQGHMSVCYSSIETAIVGKPYFIYGGDQEKIKKEILKAKIKSL